MKNIFLIIALAGGVSLAGCGNKEENNSVMAGMMQLDLSQYGKNITINVPDSVTGPLSVEDMGGILRIAVGKTFQIDIKEGPGDMATKKDVDIKQNEVYQLDTMVVDQPDGIIYCWHMKGAAPSDDPTKSIYEYRMFSTVKIGEVTYEVEDVAGEIFGRTAAMKMLDAAKTIKAKETKKPDT